MSRKRGFTSFSMAANDVEDNLHESDGGTENVEKEDHVEKEDRELGRSRNYRASRVDSMPPRSG